MDFGTQEIQMALCYVYPEPCRTVPDADAFVVNLAVCAKDSRTARLLIISERKMLRRIFEPIACYKSIGNKMLVDRNP